MTAIGGKKEARQLARGLVDAKLAACAQISRIDSIYAWKGKIETGKEYRVLFKTIQASWPVIEQAIRDLHSYDLPAIHAFPFTAIHGPYAAWIEENASG